LIIRELPAAFRVKNDFEGDRQSTEKLALSHNKQELWRIGVLEFWIFSHHSKIAVSMGSKFELCIQ